MQDVRELKGSPFMGGKEEAVLYLTDICNKTSPAKPFYDVGNFATGKYGWMNLYEFTCKRSHMKHLPT
jgi:hypothetical protein